MNPMDTLPTGMTGEQVLDWTATLAKWMHMLLNPALIALVLNTMLVQAVEAFDHLAMFRWAWTKGTEDVSHGKCIVIAWVLTIPLMGLACVGLDIPFRGANFGFALLSGPIAFVISEFGLKKLGINLDQRFGKDAAPVPPSGPPVG
jgi:hypothetical protein